VRAEAGNRLGLRARPWGGLCPGYSWKIKGNPPGVNSAKETEGNTLGISNDGKSIGLGKSTVVET
jgi:hypothetical protein